MSRNFLPLISHLIREVSKLNAYGGVGKVALDYFGQENGKVSKKDLEGYVLTLKEWGLFRPGEPLSCGVTANAFCYVFMGKRDPSNACTLDELAKIVADRQQRLIRIQLKGHTYVIEQIDTRQGFLVPMGNVYQSNIAVIGGGEEVGISLNEYLDDHHNPIALYDYLGALATLIDGKKPTQERIELYKKLYTTAPYRQNPNAQPITPELFGQKAATLGIQSIAWDKIDERQVLKAVNMILTAYGNLSGANEARNIWFTRCWT